MNASRTLPYVLSLVLLLDVSSFGVMLPSNDSTPFSFLYVYVTMFMQRHCWSLTIHMPKVVMHPPCATAP